MALALIKSLGDRWLPATVLMFGPRWAFLFPIPALVLWAVLRRRVDLLIAQGVTLAVVLGPLMGLCLPVGTLLRPTPTGQKVRAMSLNRGMGELDTKALARLIADERIDVVCLQEFRLDPGLDLYFLRTGWNRDLSGSIYSRFPISHDLADPDRPWVEHGSWPLRLRRVRVRLPDGREMVVASAHLPTMTHGFGKLIRGDLAGVGRYVAWRGRQAAELVSALRETSDVPTIVGADFNMPPDSPLMAMIRTFFPSGFEQVGWGFGYTRPSRFSWIGIDRILASRDLRFTRSWVGPAVGSDHLPILAEVVVGQARR